MNNILDGWTTDRDAVYFEAFNKLMLPEQGEITVKIISIVDLRTFYVAIKGLPHCMTSVTRKFSLYNCFIFEIHFTEFEIF